MKVARVTVRAMTQGLMAGRADLGAGLTGGGGAILAGSMSVAVAIGVSDLPCESLWTLAVVCRSLKKRDRMVS